MDRVRILPSGLLGIEEFPLWHSGTPIAAGWVTAEVQDRLPAGLSELKDPALLYLRLRFCP